MNRPITIAISAAGLLLLMCAGRWLDTAVEADRPALAQPLAPIPTETAPRPPKPASSVMSGPALQVASTRTAQNYPGAIAQLYSRSLDWDIARVTAREEVRSACLLVHRPDSASPRVDMDPNRRPWLDQLQQRCAGVSPELLLPMALEDPAMQAWRAQVPETVAADQGVEQAQRVSQELLSTAVDSALLYQALRFALYADQLPLRQIFVGTPIPVTADIELALLNAADWIACERSTSCGSDGLWTLYTCAQFGCAPGTDLPTALAHTSPRWQFEISRAIVRWTMRAP